MIRTKGVRVRTLAVCHCEVLTASVGCTAPRLQREFASLPLPKYLDPVRYAAYALRRLRKASYNLKAVQTVEREKFVEAGFDVLAGRQRLDAVLMEISNRAFNHVTGTDSVHWLLFACLSLTPWAQRARDILEIGTFRGKTTLILSKLFPGARIVTVDLPPSDPILLSSYGRHDPKIHADHQARRNGNIAAAKARFVEANSFFLPQIAPGPYDLVWVDGGHVYPEIAWDLCNAWHMCRRDGIILCDDVYTHPRGGDGIYGSIDAENVIQYLVRRGNLTASHFLKRENPDWSADPRQRKFVVMLRKRMSQSVDREKE